jgi:hypothetical protein
MRSHHTFHMRLYLIIWIWPLRAVGPPWAHASSRMVLTQLYWSRSHVGSSEVTAVLFLSLPPPYSVYLQRLLAVRRRSFLFRRLSQSAVGRCRRRVLSALVHSRDAAAPHAAVLLCFDSNVFLLLAQQMPRCRHLQQLSLPLRRAFLLPFGAANAKEHSSGKHHCFSNTVSLLLSQQAPGCLTVSQDAVIRCRRRDINSIRHHFFGNTAILLLLQQAAVPCCFHSRRTVFCNSSSCCPDSSKRRET